MIVFVATPNKNDYKIYLKKSAQNRNVIDHPQDDRSWRSIAALHFLEPPSIALNEPIDRLVCRLLIRPRLSRLHQTLAQMPAVRGNGDSTRKSNQQADVDSRPSLLFPASVD